MRRVRPGYLNIGGIGIPAVGDKLHGGCSWINDDGPSMWPCVRGSITDTKPAVVYGDLLMPNKPSGKVTALILSHGSSGVSPFSYEVWAAHMNAAGVAVFIVDSFKPRGISESAQDQGVLSPAANIADGN